MVQRVSNFYRFQYVSAACHHFFHLHSFPQFIVVPVSYDKNNARYYAWFFNIFQ